MKMIRRTCGVLASIMILLSFACRPAQAQRTITIRMIDSANGRQISTTDFLVQINHEKSEHANWVQQKESDGPVEVAVPPEATEIQIRGKYDNSMSLYVNCDTELERKAARGGEVPDHWYSVADILAKGIVAPDACKSKETGKQDYIAKPGEFVFFVRKHNWKEAGQD
jgi:hypothetical protein